MFFIATPSIAILIRNVLTEISEASFGMSTRFTILKLATRVATDVRRRYLRDESNPPPHVGGYRKKAHPVKDALINQLNKPVYDFAFNAKIASCASF